MTETRRNGTARPLSAAERRRAARRVVCTLRISGELLEAVDAEVEARRVATGLPRLVAEKAITRSGLMAEAVEVGLAELVAKGPQRP